jgi:hypothetical protein
MRTTVLYITLRQRQLTAAYASHNGRCADTLRSVRSLRADGDGGSADVLRPVHSHSSNLRGMRGIATCGRTCRGRDLGCAFNNGVAHVLDFCNKRIKRKLQVLHVGQAVQDTGGTRAVRTLALKPPESPAWSELGACAIVNNDAAEITHAQDVSKHLRTASFAGTYMNRLLPPPLAAAPLQG